MLSVGAVPICAYEEKQVPFYNFLLDFHVVGDGVVLCKLPGRLWGSVPEDCLPSPFLGFEVAESEDVARVT